MAAIDKIYVDSYDEYIMFRDWCNEQAPLTDKYGKTVRLSDYVYKYNESFYKNGAPVFMGPYYLDAYLIRNCPFDFIQRELMLNYGHWSQEKIDEAYEIVTNRTEENKEFYTWLTEDDFKVVNGVITMPNLEKSAYEKIKDGELYTSPKVEYKIGRHFKCIKKPVRYFNRPLEQKRWMVQIELPYEFSDYMWYNEDTDTWDLSAEFVKGSWKSNTAFSGTIKALGRKILKWNFPIGTKIKVTGRYVEDTYEFTVKK